MKRQTTKLFKGDILVRDESGKFTELFREKAFLVWYTNGRISLHSVLSRLEGGENFHIPTYPTIQKWSKEDKWSERADELDLQVREEVEKHLISEKALMQSRHAEIGRKVYEKGITFIEEHGIKTTGQALRAIELGVSIENDATNLEKLLKAVAQMDDPKVVSRASQLLAKVKLKNEPDDQV